LAFGVFWVLLFVFTNVLFGLGDCTRDLETGRCEGQPENFDRMVLGGELLLLVVVVWIFYRREMKDGGF
jgi:hypothetical protein